MANNQANNNNNPENNQPTKDDVFLRKAWKLALIVLGVCAVFIAGPAGVLTILCWMVVIRVIAGLAKWLWNSL